MAIATSDGKLRDRQFLTVDEHRRVVGLQRKLCHSAAQCRSPAKTRKALGKIRRRERWRRGDFCAQVAHELATNHELVVLEDLKTKQMDRTARATPASADMSAD